MGESPLGMIILLNLYAGIKDASITVDFASRLIGASSAAAPATHTEAMGSFLKTVRGSDIFGYQHTDRHVPRANAHRRPSRQLARAIASDSFARRVYGRPVTRVKPRLRYGPRNRTADAVAAYVADLETCTRDGAWIGPGSTLGSPPPSRRVVWVTDLAFLHDQLAGLSAGDRPERCRDVVGLVDFGRSTFLLVISFAEADALHDGSVAYAPPTVADEGSRRFLGRRVGTSSWYATAWGHTIDLALVDAKKGEMGIGAPERIASPLQLETLRPSLAIAPLGWLTTSRGQLEHDDDSAYVALLESVAGVAPGTVGDELLRILP